MTTDELAAILDEKFERIDKRFESIDNKFASIDEKFDRIDGRFERLEQKMDDGFNASKARDEELRDLTKFGLEAREVLRDEMHRRFDEADRKNDQQVTLLQDAVLHLSKHQ